MAEIKLVLIGQIYNKEGGYAYLSNNTSEREEWLKGVNDLDPRSVRDNLSLKDQKIPTFSMWENELGWYYGISAFNPYDSRMGHAMVVLYLGHHVPTDGALWERLMKDLLNKFITVPERKDVNDKEVEDLRVELTNSLREVKKSSTSFSSDISATNGYCVYDSSDDLYNRWLYPMQLTQYATIRRLFILSKENLDGAKMTTWQNITSKPDKYYSIVNLDSAHISVDKSHAVLGDTILITYKKENAGESTQSVKVEHTSPYLTLDKQTLILKSLREVEGRINFSKKVLFEVRSKAGQPVKDFKLTIDGKHHLLPSGANTILVSLTAGKHKVVVVGSGFEKYEKDLDANQYMPCTETPKYSIELEPSLSSLPLSIRYKGQEYYDRVYVKSDSKLYIPLSELGAYTLRREKAGSWFNKWTIIIAATALLLGLLIGGWIGHAYLSNPDVPINKEQTIQKDDIEYLNKNNIWKLVDLKSSEHQKLFDAVQSGNYSIFKAANNNNAQAIYNSLDKLESLDKNALKVLLSKYNAEINLAELKKLAEEKLEEIAKEIDKKYLITNSVWKRSELKSKRYSNGFMDGVKDGNITGLMADEHNDLLTNKNWKSIREKLEKVSKAKAKELMKECYDETAECIDLAALEEKLSKAASNRGNSSKTSSPQDTPPASSTSSKTDDNKDSKTPQSTGVSNRGDI